MHKALAQELLALVAHVVGNRGSASCAHFVHDVEVVLQLVPRTLQNVDKSFKCVKAKKCCLNNVLKYFVLYIVLNLQIIRNMFLEHHDKLFFFF